MPDNPFTYGNPIKDPVLFFNRKNEIRQVVNRLLSSAHESTSIVGERRMGKTSLFKYLTMPQVAESYGLRTDKFCLIYIDCEGLSASVTPNRFWRRVLTLMERDINDPAIIPPLRTFLQQEEFDLFDLEDIFEKVKRNGLTTVVFMDEFESITQNPKFGPDFFGGLRSLAIHSGLSLVTATQQDLVDLCHSEEVKCSPFFNIFATVVLRPFSLEDSYNLVEGHLKYNNITITQEEKDYLVKLGGGHPFFLQIAGFHLLDEKMRMDNSRPLLARVRDRFEEQAASHFSYLWKNCTESEKVTLLTVITCSQDKPSQKTIPTLNNLVTLHPQARLDVPELMKRGLLAEVDENYGLFSPSLGKWILGEISASPGQEESQATVDEWLTAGRIEQLDAAREVLPKFKKQYWPVIGAVLRDLSLNVVGSGLFELMLKVMLKGM